MTTLANPNLSSVVVNGYEIHYLDIGDGVPVVFVHGGLGDYRTWEAQISAFSRDYRVIAISRRYAYPNKQQAKESNDFSVTPHARDLTELLKSLGLGPVHLVGHSFGGYTSLLTALEHPELLRSLTLAEPPVMSLLQYVPDGEALGNRLFAEVMAPTAEAFLNNDDEGAVELFIDGIMGEPQYYSLGSQEQKELMMDNAFEHKGIMLTEDPFPFLDREAIGQLATPTLLIKGENSPRVLTEITDVLAKYIDNNELAILPDTSHGLEYENPEGFNRIVLNFVNKY